MKVIEKMRTMTAEEVAKLIYGMDSDESEFNSFCLQKCVPDEDHHLQCPYEDEHCEICMKEWLESEVEEV